MKRRIRRRYRLVRKVYPPLKVTSVIRAEEWPYFISYFIFLVFMFLSTSFYRIYINSVWKPVLVVCVGFLAVYELVKNGLTWKNLLIVAGVSLLFLNIMRIAVGLAQYSVAMMMAYMFCARKIPFRKISRFTMIVSGICLVFIVGSSLAGIIQNYTDTGKRHREYLGFLYALYGPTIMSNITLLWIYDRREKVSVKGVVILVLLNWFFYMKTNSRLCFFLTVFMLLFSLVLRRHSAFFLRRKLLCRLMVCSFILTFIVSYTVTVNYTPSVSWMASLNRILGSRLSLGKESLEQIGYGALGIEGIEWVGNGLDMYGKASTETYLYVDNYYIQIMQRFGWVFLVASLFVLTIAAGKAYKRKDIYLLSIFALLAVRFMIDNLSMYLHYNTFWLAAGILVFSGRNARIAQPDEKNVVRKIIPA